MVRAWSTNPLAFWLIDLTRSLQFWQVWQIPAYMCGKTQHSEIFAAATRKL